MKKSKPLKKQKPVKNTRKKRTTIKVAFDEGYNTCKSQLITYTLDTMNKMIEEFNDDIQHYPRNTKFVELQLDALIELRERLKYTTDIKESNEINPFEKSRPRPKI